jgi:hypothetical protein
MLPVGSILTPNLGSELNDVLAAPEQRKSLFRTPHGTSESMGRKHPLNALSADVRRDEKQPVPIGDFGRLTDKETDFQTAPHGLALSTLGDSAIRPDTGFSLSQSLTRLVSGSIHWRVPLRRSGPPAQQLAPRAGDPPRASRFTGEMTESVGEEIVSLR